MEELIKQRMQYAMDDSVRRGEMPGCTLLVKKDGKEEVYLESGYADLETGALLKRDTIFRLFSMSKPITAAAVMILVERGVIDLADPVSRYLPGFQNQRVIRDGKEEKPWKEVSIMDLMNMTSGLVYGGPNETGIQTEAVINELIAGLKEKDGGKYGTVEVANRLGECPLLYQPGTAWCYGTSADVAGAVVEVAAGMRFGDFLKQELFEPLGMKDTDFWVPEEKQSRLAKAYECREGDQGQLYTGDNLGILNTMHCRPAFESGGAGLCSTIDDYMRYADMLMNGGVYEGKRILQPATVAYMTGHRLSARQQSAFEEWIGLEGFTYGNLMRVMTEPGRAVTLGSRGEYGWDGWLGCYFTNAPEEKLTILMMTQKKDAGTFALTRKLRNMIYSAY